MGSDTQTLLNRLRELVIFALIVQCYGKAPDRDLVLVRYRGRVLKICSGRSIGKPLDVIAGNGSLTTVVNAGLENPHSHMYIGDSRLRGRRHCGNGVLQFLEFNKSRNAFNTLATDDIPSVVKHSSFVVSVTNPGKDDVNSKILHKNSYQHDPSVTGTTADAAALKMYEGSVDQLKQQYAPHHEMIQEFMLRNTYVPLIASKDAVRWCMPSWLPSLVIMKAKVVSF
ncbi:unnamed protein product [Closterium sp. Naga37s-1]|nr:unnamed protein product [Closterium sp. Naga37s-1]